MCGRRGVTFSNWYYVSHWEWCVSKGMCGWGVWGSCEVCSNVHLDDMFTRLCMFMNEAGWCLFTRFESGSLLRERERDRQTDRQTDRETDRQRDRQTDRQTETEMCTYMPYTYTKNRPTPE